MSNTTQGAGGQRDPAPAEPLHEQMAQLAHEIEDDLVAERLIHLAAQVRTLEREAAEGRD